MKTKKIIIDELIELKEYKKVLEAQAGIILEGIKIFSKEEIHEISQKRNHEDLEFRIKAVNEEIRECEDELAMFK
jgi:hypothetical protein